MIVTIPKCAQHEGRALATYEISDYCPICGEKRGKIFGTHSFDGSRRLNVDAWINPCGHIDLYERIQAEGKIVEFKASTNFGEYE